MAAQQVHWWLRAEVKDGEGRVALTPENARHLIVDKGHSVSVERSATRCFPDADYQEAGATLVDGPWNKPEDEGGAPASAIVLGLKELDTTPQTYLLSHRHIYFAHCYKNQDGWADLLGRYAAGKGSIDDLEFLVDDSGRRVAAFGKPAGLVGAALALLEYCDRRNGQQRFLSNDLKPWCSQESMVADIKAALASLESPPVVWIIGALGRVGSGAIETCRQAGIPEENLLLWDMKETASGGPFDAQLQQADILINCVYLTQKIPSFVDEEAIARAGETRRLLVVSDVSCDYTSRNHPLPFFSQGTDIHKPVWRSAHANPISVIAIDHLPSLLPRESSIAYSNDLFPTLATIGDSPLPSVWRRSSETFQSHLKRALQVGLAASE